MSSTDHPPQPRYVLTVTSATYREIRQLLLTSHAGLFERHTTGVEMLNLHDVGLVMAPPKPKVEPPQHGDDLL